MHVLFEDRQEAGRRIAKKLTAFHDTDAVILCIPRGGVPVAATVAHRLRLPWSFIVTRKLPVPTNPEAGFGAIAADGSIVLNNAMLTGLRLAKSQIDAIAQDIRAEVARRTETYSRVRPTIDVTGKTVIILDDGLASGYTMLAAIKSIRAQNPARIVAVAPVASRSAAAMIEASADECIFEIVSPAVPFAVADFYVVWHDLTDEDILPILETGS
jgi:putative phosphoribosyl transferase